MITTAYLNSQQIHGGSNIGLRAYARKLIVRTDRVDRAREHGSIDFTRYYSGQSFSLAGNVFGAAANLQGYLDLIRAVSWLDTAVTFKIQRLGIAVAEQAAVVVVDADFPQSFEDMLTASWTLELFAADPRLYSQTLTTTTGTSNGTSVSISPNNTGNVNTPVLWTVTGPVAANYIIGNATTGHNIKINTAIAGGHTHVIDSLQHTVKLDGTTLHPEYVDVVNTYWDGLNAGSNTVTLTGTGQTNAVTALKAEFYAARG